MTTNWAETSSPSANVLPTSAVCLVAAPGAGTGPGRSVLLMVGIVLTLMVGARTRSRCRERPAGRAGKMARSGVPFVRQARGHRTATPAEGRLPSAGAELLSDACACRHPL